MTCSFCNNGVMHKKRGCWTGFNLREKTIDYGDSLEYPQHMFWLRNNKNILLLLRTLTGIISVQ